MSISLHSFLADNKVEASAPCRIDSGGTWDIKAMALPLQRIGPVTINIALNLRTFVTLTPFKKGWVKVSSEGFPRSESFPVETLPFNSSFGIFFGAVSYFGFHGLEINIRSQSPVRSALGGSSAALIATIKALARVHSSFDGKNLSAEEILHLAYHLEDGINGGRCGLQDHAAAVYGGVNIWKWHYGYLAAPFSRKPLLDGKEQKKLSEHLLVAYSGKTHISSKTNRKWIDDFFSGQTRMEWINVNEIVKNLASAIMAQQWENAAAFLREEMVLRKKITPEALIPVTSKLIEQAELAECGARFTGAGAGGSLWAIGGKKNIQQLKKYWKSALASVKNGKILDCEVDPKGAE